MGRPLNLHRMGNRHNLEAHQQISVKANVGSGAVTAYLWQQKNQYSFRVTTNMDPTLGTMAICKLVNKANGALTFDPVTGRGEMNLIGTPAVGPAFKIKRITNRFAWDFLGNRYFWEFSAVAGKIVVTSDPTAASTDLDYRKM